MRKCITFKGLRLFSTSGLLSVWPPISQSLRKMVRTISTVSLRRELTWRISSSKLLPKALGVSP